MQGLVFVLALVIMILMILIRSSVRETFDGSVDKKNLVMITSVIHTVDAPLSYAKRSVLTHSQRFQQTLKTITTANQRIPNAYVVLIEGSDLTKDEEEALMKQGCDEIYSCSASAKEAINGPHKSVGEAHLLLDYLEGTTVNPSKYATFSKISGRYYLTDQFDWSSQPIDKPMYSCEYLGEALRCNTRFYRFPITDFSQYVDVLRGALNDPVFRTGGTDIESYNIFKTFPENRTMKPQLIGVKGFVAPFGYEVEDFS